MDIGLTEVLVLCAFALLAGGAPRHSAGRAAGEARHAGPRRRPRAREEAVG